MAVGRQQLVGQRAVVGEQEQTLSVLVQPAHREQAHPPQLIGQQGEDRLLPGVLGGGNHSGGLVQHHIHIGLRGDGTAVHGDQGARLHLVLRPGRALPRHLHPARLDKGLGLLPGPPPGGSQQLVQSFHGGFLPSPGIQGGILCIVS